MAYFIMLPGRARAAWARTPLLADEDRPALAMALAMVAPIVVGLASGRMSYGGDLDPAVAFLAILWACGHVVQLARLDRIAQALKLAAVLLLVAMVSALSSAVLATVARPWADTALIGVDQALFGRFAWPHVEDYAAAHGGQMICLSYAYSSLNVQPILAVTLLCLIGRTERARRFVIAWTLSLLICLGVFTWLPAKGAYLAFGIEPGSVPGVWVGSAWDFLPTIEGLRSGTVSALSSETLQGLVTMPSFHACAAVLLAWAFASTPWLRYPFLALNALMWLSAVPIGGHYLVDVAAGSLVAGASIVASGHLLRRSGSAAWSAAALQVKLSNGALPADEPVALPT